ncbi:MAG: signal peptidase I, partial [Marmoricola sp.]
MTLKRLFQISREVALSVTAIVGALCLVGLALAVFFGIHPLMFRSGSMSPTIRTGDLAFAQNVSASSLRKGDIASVVEPGGSRVTHRVVSNTKVGAVSQLTMKGDANKVVDPQVYDVTKAERVFWVIPKAGYVVNWFSQSPGSFVLAAYLALMGILMFRRRRSDDALPPANPADDAPEAPETSTTVTDDLVPARPRRRRRLLAVGATAVVAVAVAVGWGQSTWAYWVRPATVSGTTFAAASAWAPTGKAVVTCGTTGKKSVTINWTAVAGATSYDLYYPNGTTLAQNVTTTTVTLTTTNQSGTFTVHARNASGAGPASNSAT